MATKGREVNTPLDEKASQPAPGQPAGTPAPHKPCRRNTGDVSGVGAALSGANTRVHRGERAGSETSPGKLAPPFSHDKVVAWNPTNH